MNKSKHLCESGCLCRCHNLPEDLRKEHRCVCPKTMNKSKQREQEWEQSSDYKNAVVFANEALDRPYADPDDEIGTISRQFLRMIERLTNQRKAILEEVDKLTCGFIVGCASAKKEDIGTEKADPDSQYNQGYKDGVNKTNSYIRQKLSILEGETK